MLLMTLLNFVSGDRTLFQGTELSFRGQNFVSESRTLFQGDRTLFEGTELSFRGTLVQQTGVAVWHTAHVVCEVRFLVP